MKRFYPRGLEHIMGGDIDYINQQIAVMLVDLSEYTPVFADDEYLSDIPLEARIASTLLTGKTNVKGVVDADDTIFSQVTGTSCTALVFYVEPLNGNEGTSILIAFNDGKSQVTCAIDCIANDTTVHVDKLTAGIASGALVTFINGTVATLTTPAVVGDRTLTVAALLSGILAEETAEINDVDSYFPIVPDGNNITITWSSGAEKIWSL